jgi:hypothetical protein
MVQGKIRKQKRKKKRVCAKCDKVFEFPATQFWMTCSNCRESNSRLYDFNQTVI